MKLANDYYNVRTAEGSGSGSTIRPGGYVCKITKVTVDDHTYNSPRFDVEFDIAEGEFTDYYKKRYMRAIENGWSAKWGGTFTVYTEKKDGGQNQVFKDLITCVEKSNDIHLTDGFTLDEQEMVGKLVGFLFNDAPYAGIDRETHKYKPVHVIKALFPRSIDKIREGDFKLPKPKEMSEKDKALLKGYKEEPMTKAEEDDLPF